jgi:DNA (cytosine-5)-methyltransferase 1
LTFGSLFAGIGGLDLGLERAGMECKWQVENDAYASRVLAKHWPNVRRWGDIRTFVPDTTAERFGTWGPQRISMRRQSRADSEWVSQFRVDLICGGFPCQDISFAGKGEGLEGKRSGLFFELARVVRTLRPRYVVLENVSGLLVRGLDTVLGALATLGYDAEWHCIPAYLFGLPHSRDRVFIVAHRDGLRELQPERSIKNEWRWSGDRRKAVDRILSSGGILRSSNGVPSGLDRIPGIGNAVTPVIAEFTGRLIMDLPATIKQAPKTPQNPRKPQDVESISPPAKR